MNNLLPVPSVKTTAYYWVDSFSGWLESFTFWAGENDLDCMNNALYGMQRAHKITLTDWNLSDA